MQFKYLQLSGVVEGERDLDVSLVPVHECVVDEIAAGVDVQDA